jgi:hypothetical protein
LLGSALRLWWLPEYGAGALGVVANLIGIWQQYPVPER